MEKTPGKRTKIWINLIVEFSTVGSSSVSVDDMMTTSGVGGELLTNVNGEIRLEIGEFGYKGVLSGRLNFAALLLSCFLSTFLFSDSILSTDPPARPADANFQATSFDVSFGLRAPPLLCKPFGKRLFFDFV